MISIIQLSLLSLLVLLLLNSIDYSYSFPTTNGGIVGETQSIATDSKEIQTLVNNVMKKPINKQRYLYLHHFPQDDEYFTLKYTLYNFTVLDSSVKDCFLNIDGKSGMLQTRKLVDVGGYRYFNMEPVSIGRLYNLILLVNDRTRQQPDQPGEQKPIELDDSDPSIGCKQIKLQIFKDTYKMYSIPEFICMSEQESIPLSFYTGTSSPSSSLLDINNEIGNTNNEHQQQGHGQLNIGVKPTIKIMSYNTWNYNAPWRKRRVYMTQLIREESPDLIAFQEIRYSQWDGESIDLISSPKLMGQERNQIQHIVNLLAYHNEKYHYTFLPSMVYNTASGLQFEGLAILSKYKILDIDSIKLSRDFLDKEDDHQRSCLMVKVEVPGHQPVQLFTSHFSLSLEGQQRNAFEVYNWTRQFPSSPSIFVGDLNSLPDTTGIQFLNGQHEIAQVKSDFKDMYLDYCMNNNDKVLNDESNICDNGSSTTFNGMTYPTLQGIPSKRIDYIFKRDDNKLNQVDFKIVGKSHQPTTDNNNLYASDHVSLVSTFTWN